MAKYILTGPNETTTYVEASYYKTDHPVVTFYDAGDIPVYTTSLGNLYSIERDGAVTKQ